MTELYFIRHARPDYSNHDDAARPLTAEGRASCQKVTAYLADKDIDLVVSSPFRRAVDTITPFAQTQALEVSFIPAFQERKIAGAWIEDYNTFSRRQWEDFSYKEADGESLGETLARWRSALDTLLADHPGSHIVVGCHGAGLSALLHHYDNTYGYAQFCDMVDRMPWCAHLTFDGTQFISWEAVDLSLPSCDSTANS